MTYAQVEEVLNSSAWANVLGADTVLTVIGGTPEENDWAVRCETAPNRQAEFNPLMQQLGEEGLAGGLKRIEPPINPDGLREGRVALWLG